jgi:tetratricopeptide (TPR) repeat protein
MARYYQVINQDSMRISYLLKSWHIRERLKEKRPFVWIGIQISNYIEHANYKQSSYYLERIKTALGKDTVNNEEISIIYKQQAIILAKEGNYKGSLSLFSIVRKFYGRNVFPYDLCNLYNEIGLVLWDLSNFETSLKYYLKALKIAKANHYEKELVQVSNNIGWIYLELNQLSLAQEYSKDALEKAIANRFSFEEAAAYNLLGLVEEKYGNYQQALDYFKKSLAIRKANKFLDKEASTLNNMSNLYALMSDLVKSEATGLQSLKINNEIKNLLGQCESHQVLGQVYVSRNNFTKALNHLNEAEALATRMKLNDILVKVYDSKRELYRKQSDMVNAYYYLGLMQVVHDSLFNQNLGNRIATMKYDFQIDQ